MKYQHRRKTDLILRKHCGEIRRTNYRTLALRLFWELQITRCCWRADKPAQANMQLGACVHKERSTVEELQEELQGRSHDQMHFITELSQ